MCKYASICIITFTNCHDTLRVTAEHHRYAELRTSTFLKIPGSYLAEQTKETARANVSAPALGQWTWKTVGSRLGPRAKEK